MPSPAPVPTSGAVFLSYAREDSAAARRIADALRAFGVEVWFDQHELRGGDVWDQKIRKQIKECVLFVPIVSATTEGRAEGYFRREWKLAVERTADMAASRAFLLPVVIDDTREGGAEVPEEFMRVQWTRLENGVPSPDFVAQVKRLLEAPRAAGRDASPRRPLIKSESEHGPLGETSLPARRRSPVIISAAIGAVAAGALIVWFGATKVPSGPTAAAPSAAAKTTAPSSPASPSTPAKSIAVLPFENLSAQAENAVFASGMHDDVITALTKIHGLKVISRTSVMLYKPGGRNLKQIATELGVTTVLEGSVQRSGNKVRVNVQLIDAGSDNHLWAETYTEDLQDFFTLQTKLATEITRALKVRLSPQEKSLIARPGTVNGEAYALYQSARERLRSAEGRRERAQFEEVVALLEQAVRHDPQFLSAFVLLSRAHGMMNWFGYIDSSAGRRAAARNALEAARRISPNDPQTRLASGMYAYLCENNWQQAVTELRAAEAGIPNDADVANYLGLASRRMGRLTDALSLLSRAMALDPMDSNLPSVHVSIVIALRRYAEAVELARHYLTRFPENRNLRRHLADPEFELTGDTEKYLVAIEALLEDGERGDVRRYQTALRRRDYAAAEEILAQPGFPGVPDAHGVTIEAVSLHRAYIASLRGQRSTAMAAAEEALVAYRDVRWTTRQEPWVKMGIATAHALAGRAELAERLAAEAIALQARHDQWSLPALRRELARLYAILGRHEQLLACLRDIMINPGYQGPNAVRLDPVWDSVRSDPRFEQYLKLAKPL